MNLSKKGVVLTALIILLSVSGVFAQTIVKVPEVQQPSKGFFNFGFLSSNIFLGLILLIIIMIVLGVLLVFLFRYIIRYIKLRSDIFYKLKIEKLKLAKIQGTYPSKYWWNTEKNTPIRLIKKDSEGEIMITQPIAYHRGDYASHEGNIVIAMSLRGKKKWLIFPTTDLLIIPNKEEREVSIKDYEGKKSKETYKNLPKAKDIIKFHQNEILIYAESLSSTGMFYIPVLKSDDGKVIDLSMPTYQSLKEVAIEDYLYEQTSEFVGIAKKSMDINPSVNYIKKTNDTSQSVEIPQGERR